MLIFLWAVSLIQINVCMYVYVCKSASNVKRISAGDKDADRPL